MYNQMVMQPTTLQNGVTARIPITGIDNVCIDISVSQGVLIGRNLLNATAVAPLFNSTPYLFQETPTDNMEVARMNLTFPSGGNTVNGVAQIQQRIWRLTPPNMGGGTTNPSATRTAQNWQSEILTYVINVLLDRLANTINIQLTGNANDVNTPFLFSIYSV